VSNYEKNYACGNVTIVEDYQLQKSGKEKQNKLLSENDEKIDKTKKNGQEIVKYVLRKRR